MSIYKYDSTQGELIPISGSTVYAEAPIGSIIPYGGTTAPDGFLLCQGQAVSRTTYSELYAVIGDSFKGAKADPASGNFYLPDLREVTLKGVGENYAYAINNHGTINNVGGFIEDRVQDHVHDTYLNGDTNCPFGTKEGGDTGINYADVDRQVGAGWNVKANTIYTGRHGTTTEVKAVGVNYIIKAKHTSVPADFMDAVDDAVEEAVADFSPVNAVANGNMKAVTSNAVYDTLMNITTLTPTKTANVGIVYEAEFLRMGRLVFVNLNLIVSSGILFTGLPKPTGRQTFTINGFYETDKALRLIVNTDGSIETDNSSTITNQNIGGHIVYITSEN